MGLFNNLIFSTAQGAAQGAIGAAGSALNNYKHFDGTVKLYTSKPYDNIFIYSAKRDIMQATFAELNSLYPKIRLKTERKRMSKTYDKYMGNAKQKIIEHNKSLIKSENAWHYRGQATNEGLLMWIKGESSEKAMVEFNMYWDKVKNLSGYQDNALFDIVNKDKSENTYAKVAGESVFLDMTAMVNMSSRKNLVLTRVQGRDYSRKEMISNGDLEFSISGKIVGNYPDTYPVEEASRFLKLMNYKGVIQVYGLMFEQLNVTQILVKDFRMNQQTGFKNVQPYSFTCVAVEPDREVEIVEDTLTGINLQISSIEGKKGWAKVLDSIKKSAINQASNTLEILTSKII